MNKVENALPQNFQEDIDSNAACGPAVSDGDLNIHQRMSQLMVLLQQIDESARGLDDLHMEELSEMVSSALGLCGFVDPTEAREAIAQVLEAIERSHPTAGGPASVDPSLVDRVSVDRIPADAMQEARPFHSALGRRT